MRNIEALAVLIIAVGNIASPTADITRDNRILITRVGIIRTQERAIDMGVTSLKGPAHGARVCGLCPKISLHPTKLNRGFALQLLDSLQYLFAC